VFFIEDRVFRLVANPQTADLYSELLKSEEIEQLFSLGLVRTWIPSDISVNGAALILEHERIPFETHPAEHTDEMHWQAAISLVKLGSILHQLGYTLKDAHPWNTMFLRGEPIFIDFGSIKLGTGLSQSWLEEFYRYFGAPIWLSASRFRKLAPEYRRQHHDGFGLVLMRHKWIRRFCFPRIRKSDKPERVFQRIERWLKRHRPARANEGIWSSYEQAHGASDDGAPLTEKQLFVDKALREQNPETVLDMAANNGYYSIRAARSGAQVVAFDYEMACVDKLRDRVLTEKLEISPAVMNLLTPTPPYGLGLKGRSSFERYRSDMVFALGLIHHICLSQGLPLAVFCETCDKFARKDILVEFVQRNDRHIVDWQISDSIEYSLKDLLFQFSKLGWQVCSQVELRREGIDRMMLHFQRHALELGR
jgi:hypothetical protein